jgi:hypothetical protein
MPPSAVAQLEFVAEHKHTLDTLDDARTSLLCEMTFLLVTYRLPHTRSVIVSTGPSQAVGDDVREIRAGVGNDNSSCGTW